MESQGVAGWIVLISSPQLSLAARWLNDGRMKHLVGIPFTDVYGKVHFKFQDGSEQIANTFRSLFGISAENVYPVPSFFLQDDMNGVR
jgi:hypothetical protein